MDNISAAFTQVQQAVERHDPANKWSHAGLLDSIQRLQIAAEGPANYAATLRLQFAQAAFLLIGVESGMLDAIVSKGGTVVSADDVAAQTGQDPLLVVRTMRVLNAMKIGEERGPRMYASNQVAETLATKEQKAGLRWSAELLWPVAGNFASYMAEPGGVHQFPRLPSEKGPFEFNFGAPMFPFFDTHPVQKQHFDEYFAMRKYGVKENWFDIYPFKDQIGQLPSANLEDILVVDVGGSRGQDLISMAEACPSARTAGRLVVQDLPSTVSSLATTAQGVEFMAYDFFTPQPIKGARYYFTHHICHDWSDEKARAILQNTARAMQPESRLLLHEFVLPDQDASMRAALFDAAMMLLVCGMERTHDQWASLLQSAGLHIEKIWHPRGSGEAVIECRSNVQR